MNPRVAELVELFASSLAQSFDSMAEQRPATASEAVSSPPDGEEILWWEQPLQIDAAMKIWAGAPRETWETAGRLTLNAAGLESVEESESRNTWLEVLGQALAALTRAIGGALGREVGCQGGSEHPPDAAVEHWMAVRLTFGETALPPLYIGFSAPLEDMASARSGADRLPARQCVTGDRDEEELPSPANSRTMGLLLDVDLPVSISFGKTQLPLRDVLKLTTGSIVELNRGVSEPVEVQVNGSLVARGEVVVVDGNYGVRILEIASRSDRMRSLR